MRTIIVMEFTADLRSDTVTLPSQGMRDAMMEATLGDDVWGDDPTVNALQDRCAAMFGKEDACFVPTGTMANQSSIRAQTKPGDEIIVHCESHIVRYEAGGAAALSGCSFALASGDRGFFTADDVRDLHRPQDTHFGHTQLVSLENTHQLVSLENTHNRGGGSVWDFAQLQSVCNAAHELGLRTHLDGARIWHAIVATGIDGTKWASSFDTLSACFSKGLGCPAGSIVVGDKETIHLVRRIRKMFGGTMRQSGILAGAAIYALDHNIDRLSQDHSNAKLLAEGLQQIEGITCEPNLTDTNLVFFNVDKRLGSGEEFCRRLAEHGVLSEALDAQRIRFVTHLDVTREEVQNAIQITQSLCQHAQTT